MLSQWSDRGKLKKTIKDLEAVSSEEQNAAKVPVAMNLGRNLAVAYNPEAHNWSILGNNEPSKLKRVVSDLKEECRALNQQYQEHLRDMQQARAKISGQIDYYDKLHAFATEDMDLESRPPRLAPNKYANLRPKPEEAHLLTVSASMWQKTVM